MCTDVTDVTCCQYPLDRWLLEEEKSEYSHVQVMNTEGPSATSAHTYRYQTARRHKKQKAVSTDTAVITPDVTEPLGRTNVQGELTLRLGSWWLHVNGLM
jgi:hypothetical protein